MSNKVKFISRARKAKLLKQLSEVQEGTPEAKAIREQLGAHAPVDPAVEEAKKKAAEAAQKKLEAAKKQAAAEKKAKEEAEKKKKAEAAKKKQAAEKKKKASKSKSSFNKASK